MPCACALASGPNALDLPLSEVYIPRRRRHPEDNRLSEGKVSCVLINPAPASAPAWRLVRSPFQAVREAPPPPWRPRRLLLDEIRRRIRLRHLSPRTERAYVGWIRRFLRYHGGRHPLRLGRREIEGFLSWLAVEGKVSASTQNQALSALVFLYRDVYGAGFPWLEGLRTGAAPGAPAGGPGEGGGCGPPRGATRRAVADGLASPWRWAASDGVCLARG